MTMKRVLPFVLAALAATFAPSGASAQAGGAGALGLTIESPLAVGPLVDGGGAGAKIPGLGMRYQLSESFGLQAILVARSVSLRNDDPAPDLRGSLLGVFLRGHLVAAAHGIADLGLFGGFGFANGKVKAGDLDRASRILGFELGLRPEVFFADGRLSLHMQIGVTFAVVLNDDGPLDPLFTEGFGFGVGQNADLFGNAGLTVWFGGSGRSEGAAEEPAPGPAGGGTPPPPPPASEPASTEPPPWETGSSGGDGY